MKTKFVMLVVPGKFCMCSHVLAISRISQMKKCRPLQQPIQTMLPRSVDALFVKGIMSTSHRVLLSTLELLMLRRSCLSELNLSMDLPFISTFSSPQYKRIAAIQGDMFFEAPRRFLLEVTSKTQPAYSYSKQTTSIIFLISWES